MGTKIVLAIVLCAVCVQSEDFNRSPDRSPDYVRVKRAKHYPSPPSRFYRRPPVSYPPKSSFPYGPPPNFIPQEDLFPPSFRPKVSRRPNSDGLENDDISNIVRNLSKQELDKIIEFAGEKYKESPFEKYTTNKFTVKDTNDVSVFESPAIELDAGPSFPSGGPFITGNIAQINYDMEYSDFSTPPETIVRNKYKPSEHRELENLKNTYSSFNKDTERHEVKSPSHFSQNSAPFRPSPQYFNDVSMHTEQSSKNNEFSIMDSYIQQELYGSTSDGVNKYTEQNEMQEEPLPKPANLREDQDYEVSNSNKVPSFVKPSSYKLENFGNLPLMDYNSKLDTVSSYHVPHYTVVSPSNHRPAQLTPPYSAPSPYGSPDVPLEPAPAPSAAKEQSDAHLKATNIWTHRSRGTAYTLHDDGTLSLENGRAKVYGSY